MIILNSIKYKLFRRFGFPKVMPMNWTFNLLYRCNSRCKTCNVWKKKTNELSLVEYEKIFKNIGKNIHWAILSGGEPFLREDIVEICKLLYKYCRPSIIVIPTNGTLCKLIPKKTEEILKLCPKSHVTINLSLDGKYDKHDYIRSIKGNFDKAIKTLDGLKKLKHYKNLEIGIHTVISKFNYKDIPELYNFVMDELKPDTYITEIAEERKELDTKGMNITPSYEEYSSAIDYLINKIKESKPIKIKQLFRLKYYQMVKDYLKYKKQILPCYAGIASAQISADGEVWPCCVRADNLGNLRDNEYNFKKIWFSDKTKQIRKSIKNKECACPLASASYSNILCNYKSVIKTLLRKK